MVTFGRSQGKEFWILLSLSAACLIQTPPQLLAAMFAPFLAA